MKTSAEVDIALSDMRDAFCRVVRLSRCYHAPGMVNCHKKLDAWMQRYSNGLRSVAKDYDALEEKRCTRGREYCSFHQFCCEVHGHHRGDPDGECTCVPCLKVD